MFLLGIISILQICFIPGYLLLALGKLPRKSTLQTLVFSYCLSFFCNYLIACTLTLFNLYTSTAIYCMLFLESITLLVLWVRAKPNFSLPLMPPTQWKNFFLRLSSFNRSIFLAAIFSLLILFFYGIAKTGTIFMFADEIGSYNAWALQWLRNRMPSAIDTMGYPVAMPANWSMGYLILGNGDIQFFNKFAMAFFPFTAGLLFFDLAKNLRSTAALLSIPIFLFFLRVFTKDIIGAGPFDSNTGCVGFAAFCAALSTEEKRWDLRSFLLVGLLAASAASIKQSGLFFLFFSLIFFLYYYRKNVRALSEKARTQALFWYGTIFTLGIAWYVRIQIMIYQGSAVSESAYLIKGIHNGLNYPERFGKAVARFVSGGTMEEGHWFLKGILMLGICFFSAYSCKKKITRIVFLGFVLPYFVLWAFFFSYENRTLAPIFPFLAYCAAIGFSLLTEKKWKNISTLPAFSDTSLSISKKICAGVLATIAAIIVLLNSTIFTDAKLVEKQTYLQKQIFDAELNKKLYAYDEQEGFKGKIASLYAAIRFLPNLKEHYFKLRAPATYDLIKILEEREDISYILLSYDTTPTGYGFVLTDEAALKLVQENIAKGRYRLIFMHNNLGLVKIR